MKEKYSKVDWKKIAGMRDVLIHEYAGVDYGLVWDVVINKIPILQKEIMDILQEEGEDGTELIDV